MSGILAMLGGAGASPVTITDQVVADTVGDPADATATYQLTSTRLVKDHDGSTLEQWLDSAYAAADFEVRATVLSGTTPSGNVGTWNTLSTTRSWTLTRTIIGVRTCDLLIEIGYAGVNSPLDSATITITADVS
jgi:hypothetical protein